MDIKRLIVVWFLGLMLTGCSSTQPAPSLSTQNADIKLAEAASTISNSLTTVQGVQRATTPALSIKTLPAPNTYGMDTLASIDWTGPIGPIVEKIAQVSQYQLRVLGKAPATPALISIHEQNVPLSYILRDIDYQAGSKANIVVLPNIRVIELRYAS